MAQLLAFLSPQGTQGPQGQPLTQNPQGLAALLSMMGGPQGQQQRPMSAYPMPMPPPPQQGLPIAPYTPTPIQSMGAAGIGGPSQQPMAQQAPQGGQQQNMMAMLMQMDPTTRARMMALLGMGPMPQTGQPMGGLQGINSSPNPMPGSSPSMNADMTGTRG
jgi:hypothetical protein